VGRGAARRRRPSGSREPGGPGASAIERGAPRRIRPRALPPTDGSTRSRSDPGYCTTDASSGRSGGGPPLPTPAHAGRTSGACREPVRGPVAPRTARPGPVPPGAVFGTDRAGTPSAGPPRRPGSNPRQDSTCAGPSDDGSRRHVESGSIGGGHGRAVGSWAGEPSVPRRLARECGEVTGRRGRISGSPRRG